MCRAGGYDSNKHHRRVQPETGLSVPVPRNSPQQVWMEPASGQRRIRGSIRAEVSTGIPSTTAWRNTGFTATQCNFTVSRKNYKFSLIL